MVRKRFHRVLKVAFWGNNLVFARPSLSSHVWYSQPRVMQCTHQLNASMNKKWLRFFPTNDAFLSHTSIMERSHVTSVMDGWMDDFKTPLICHFLSSLSLSRCYWFLVSALFFVFPSQGWRADHRKGRWQRPHTHTEVPQPAPQEITMETRGDINHVL